MHSHAEHEERGRKLPRAVVNTHRNLLTFLANMEICSRPYLRFEKPGLYQCICKINPLETHNRARRDTPEFCNEHTTAHARASELPDAQHPPSRR